MIWNPASGGADRCARLIPELRAVLADRGFAVEMAPTSGPEHATALAREAGSSRAVDVVFGLGGDGTLREIAAGLLSSSVPLAILPGGTTNVLALQLGVPRHPLEAARRYRGTDHGPLEVAQLDVGVAGGIPFLMMVSVGIDAEILRRASQRAKRRFGRLAVAAQALPALRAYHPPAYTLRVGERRIHGSFVVASNIRYYGGPFEIAPRADPCDGRLDFAVFAGRGPSALLGFALDVATATHLDRDDTLSCTATAATLEGEGEVWLQIDGDPRRLELPIEIGLAAHRLSLLLPAGDG